MTFRKILTESLEPTNLPGYEKVNSLLTKLGLGSPDSDENKTGLSLTRKNTSSSDIIPDFNFLDNLYLEIFSVLRDESFRSPELRSKLMTGFRDSPPEEYFAVSQRYSDNEEEDIFLPLVPAASSNPESFEAELPSGQTIILSRNGTNLTILDEKTLREVLWYLDTLVDYRSEYVPLQNLVTKELAQRSKINR